MCGRYASARSVEDLATTFGIADDDIDSAAAPDWNVAPTKPVTAVLVRGGRRMLTTLRWGLVPGWADDPSIGSRLINARIETVGEKAAFRAALSGRRCLLPADGWYEWKTQPDGTRQPYYLAPDGGGVLAFAGLWEIWYDGDGRELVTATILTGPAPTDLAGVHDRAPVVLPPAIWDQWLDPHEAEPVAFITPTPPQVVVPRTVSAAVGDVRRNGPELTTPIVVPEQPSLF